MGKCLEQCLADKKHYANIIAIILIITIVKSGCLENLTMYLECDIFIERKNN